jgi:DNA-binding response OmpR family regulator
MTTNTSSPPADISRCKALRILVVEDDPAQAHAVERALSPFSHIISTVHDGELAVRLLQTETIDLVILDWQLPRMSGFEVLHWIRAHIGGSLAVLFLTNKVLEIDIVRALEAGADDYIVKPFRVAEFAARVNAMLRRTKQGSNANDVIRAGNYVLSPSLRSITLHDVKIELTAKEFDLAVVLFNHLGRIISRDLMAKTVWGREFDSFSRTLDTHIYRIRQKLGLDPSNGLRLSAVYTHGYRLDVVAQSEAAEDQP